MTGAEDTTIVLALSDFGSYADSDLVKLSVLINGDAVDSLSLIVHRSMAESRGRGLCLRLKELIATRLGAPRFVFAEQREPMPAAVPDPQGRAGPSPRRRGNLELSGRQAFKKGTIPAQAGKP